MKMEKNNRSGALIRKCWKNVVLSILLTVLLFAATGCAALLIGDNKKAYDLMLKTSSYFKKPSSVQIVSGELSGDYLYCVIRAKNSYGNYRSDSYFVSDDGYPLETYNNRCYSTDKLNYDLINNALASHFGVSSPSSTNIFSNILGGFNMSSGAAIFIYIVVIIVVLCLHGYLSSNASDMANDKGYEKRKWFHMCFWLGPISFIIVAAMPDKTMWGKQDTTNSLLEKMLDSYNTTAEKKEENKKEDISSILPDL